MRWSTILTSLAAMPAAYATLATDSLMDGDVAQSGYLPNHNMNPASISTFKVQWRMTYNPLEVFYAKPLVWTPPGATKEQVITVSNQNIIRIIDGYTGALITSRTLDPPFKSVDSNCGDIPNTVGITGTPIIDPSTNIMYFYSKGYKNGATGSGTLAGQYKFYAVQLPSLANVAGFPIIIDGHHANNDPTRYFLGGTVLQRTSLSMVGNIVLAGFGGHCDNFNYTGMFVAVSKVAGVGITNIQAMEASPGAPAPQTLDYTVQGGGKAGIWMSGAGIATDVAGSRVYFVTGNARGNGVNGVNIPVTGKGKPISTLQQATAEFSVSASGGLTQADYFEPYEYQSLNGGDRDFGSSGAALLDPYFSGTGVSRIVVAGGKSGKIYIMNADNLGGYMMGPGNTDAVIQTIVMTGSMLSGVASYPAEGGYIYFCPTGNMLYAYKFGKDSAGKPVFTLAGKSALVMAGLGVPVVTSLNGQAGSAIVWMADVNNGIVAYNAIPVNGVLTRITLPATGRLTKHQRPALGNGRMYSTVTNQIFALGNLGVAARDSAEHAVSALTCQPSTLNFGSVTIGQVAVINVTCEASAPLVFQGCTTDLPTFQCPGVPSRINTGENFTIAATLDLSPAHVAEVATAGYRVKPGMAGARMQILSDAGYAVAIVDVEAKVVPEKGYLVASARQMDFGGLNLGDSATRTLTLKNDGASALRLTGFAYQDLTLDEDLRVFHNISVSKNTIVGNGGFVAASFPAVGTKIATGGELQIHVEYKPNVEGVGSSLVTAWTEDGTWADVMLVGTASESEITKTEEKPELKFGRFRFRSQEWSWSWKTLFV